MSSSSASVVKSESAQRDNGPPSPSQPSQQGVVPNSSTTTTTGKTASRSSHSSSSSGSSAAAAPLPLAPSTTTTTTMSKTTPGTTVLSSAAGPLANRSESEAAAQSSKPTRISTSPSLPPQHQAPPLHPILMPQTNHNTNGSSHSSRSMGSSPADATVLTAATSIPTGSRTSSTTTTSAPTSAADALAAAKNDFASSSSLASASPPPRNEKGEATKRSGLQNESARTTSGLGYLADLVGGDGGLAANGSLIRARRGSDSGGSPISPLPFRQASGGTWSASSSQHLSQPQLQPSHSHLPRSQQQAQKTPLLHSNGANPNSNPSHPHHHNNIRLYSPTSSKTVDGISSILPGAASVSNRDALSILGGFHSSCVPSSYQPTPRRLNDEDDDDEDDRDIVESEGIPLDRSRHTPLIQPLLPAGTASNSSTSRPLLLFDADRPKRRADGSSHQTATLNGAPNDRERHEEQGGGNINNESRRSGKKNRSSSPSHRSGGKDYVAADPPSLLGTQGLTFATAERQSSRERALHHEMAAAAAGRYAPTSTWFSSSSAAAAGPRTTTATTTDHERFLRDMSSRRRTTAAPPPPYTSSPLHFGRRDEDDEEEDAHRIATQLFRRRLDPYDSGDVISSSQPHEIREGGWHSLRGKNDPHHHHEDHDDNGAEGERRRAKGSGGTSSLRVNDRQRSESKAKGAAAATAQRRQTGPTRVGSNFHSSSSRAAVADRFLSLDTADALPLSRSAATNALLSRPPAASSSSAALLRDSPLFSSSATRIPPSSSSLLFSSNWRAGETGVEDLLSRRGLASRYGTGSLSSTNPLLFGSGSYHQRGGLGGTSTRTVARRAADFWEGERAAAFESAAQRTRELLGAYESAHPVGGSSRPALGKATSAAWLTTGDASAAATTSTTTLTPPPLPPPLPPSSSHNHVMPPALLPTTTTTSGVIPLYSTLYRRPAAAGQPLGPVDPPGLAAARHHLYQSCLTHQSKSSQDLATQRALYIRMLKGDVAPPTGTPTPTTLTPEKTSRHPLGRAGTHSSEDSPPLPPPVTTTNNNNISAAAAAAAAGGGGIAFSSRTASPETFLEPTATADSSSVLRNGSTTAFFLDPESLKVWQQSPSTIVSPSNTANTAHTPTNQQQHQQATTSTKRNTSPFSSPSLLYLQGSGGSAAMGGGRSPSSTRNSRPSPPGTTPLRTYPAPAPHTHPRSSGGGGGEQGVVTLHYPSSAGVNPSGLPLNSSSSGSGGLLGPMSQEEAERMADLLSTVRALRRETGSMTSQLASVFDIWRAEVLVHHHGDDGGGGGGGESRHGDSSCSCSCSCSARSVSSGAADTRGRRSRQHSPPQRHHKQRGQHPPTRHARQEAHHEHGTPAPPVPSSQELFGDLFLSSSITPSAVAGGERSQMTAARTGKKKTEHCLPPPPTLAVIPHVSSTGATGAAAAVIRDAAARRNLSPSSSVDTPQQLAADTAWLIPEEQRHATHAEPHCQPTSSSSRRKGSEAPVRDQPPYDPMVEHGLADAPPLSLQRELQAFRNGLKRQEELQRLYLEQMKGTQMPGTATPPTNSTAAGDHHPAGKGPPTSVSVSSSSGGPAERKKKDEAARSRSATPELPTGIESNHTLLHHTTTTAGVGMITDKGEPDASSASIVIPSIANPTVVAALSAEVTERLNAMNASVQRTAKLTQKLREESRHREERTKRRLSQMEKRASSRRHEAERKRATSTPQVAAKRDREDHGNRGGRQERPTFTDDDDDEDDDEAAAEEDSRSIRRDEYDGNHNNKDNDEYYREHDHRLSHWGDVSHAQEKAHPSSPHSRVRRSSRPPSRRASPSRCATGGPCHPLHCSYSPYCVHHPCCSAAAGTPYYGCAALHACWPPAPPGYSSFAMHPPPPPPCGWPSPTPTPATAGGPVPFSACPAATAVVGSPWTTCPLHGPTCAAAAASGGPPCSHTRDGQPSSSASRAGSRRPTPGDTPEAHRQVEPHPNQRPGTMDGSTSPLRFITLVDTRLVVGRRGMSTAADTRDEEGDPQQNSLGDVATPPAKRRHSTGAELNEGEEEEEEDGGCGMAMTTSDSASKPRQDFDASFSRSPSTSVDRAGGSHPRSTQSQRGRVTSCGADLGLPPAGVRLPPAASAATSRQSSTSVPSSSSAAAAAMTKGGVSTTGQSTSTGDDSHSSMKAAAAATRGGLASPPKKDNDNDEEDQEEDDEVLRNMADLFVEWLAALQSGAVRRAQEERRSRSRREKKKKKKNKQPPPPPQGRSSRPEQNTTNRIISKNGATMMKGGAISTAVRSRHNAEESEEDEDQDEVNHRRHRRRRHHDHHHHHDPRDLRPRRRDADDCSDKQRDEKDDLLTHHRHRVLKHHRHRHAIRHSDPLQEGEEIGHKEGDQEQQGRTRRCRLAKKEDDNTNFHHPHRTGKLGNGSEDMRGRSHKTAEAKTAAEREVGEAPSRLTDVFSGAVHSPWPPVQPEGPEGIMESQSEPHHSIAATNGAPLPTTPAPPPPPPLPHASATARPAHPSTSMLSQEDESSLLAGPPEPAETTQLPSGAPQVDETASEGKPTTEDSNKALEKHTTPEEHSVPRRDAAAMKDLGLLLPIPTRGDNHQGVEPTKATIGKDATPTPTPTPTTHTSAGRATTVAPPILTSSAVASRYDAALPFLSSHRHAADARHGSGSSSRSRSSSSSNSGCHSQNGKKRVLVVVPEIAKDFQALVDDDDVELGGSPEKQQQQKASSLAPEGSTRPTGPWGGALPFLSSRSSAAPVTTASPPPTVAPSLVTTNTGNTANTPSVAVAAVTPITTSSIAASMGAIPTPGVGIPPPPPPPPTITTITPPSTPLIVIPALPLPPSPTATTAGMMVSPAQLAEEPASDSPASPPLPHSLLLSAPGESARAAVLAATSSNAVERREENQRHEKRTEKERDGVVDGAEKMLAPEPAAPAAEQPAQDSPVPQAEYDYSYEYSSFSYSTTSSSSLSSSYSLESAEQREKEDARRRRRETAREEKRAAHRHRVKRLKNAAAPPLSGPPASSSSDGVNGIPGMPAVLALEKKTLENEERGESNDNDNGNETSAMASPSPMTTSEERGDQPAGGEAKPTIAAQQVTEAQTAEKKKTDRVSPVVVGASPRRPVLHSEEKQSPSKSKSKKKKEKEKRANHTPSSRSASRGVPKSRETAEERKKRQKEEADQKAREKKYKAERKAWDKQFGKLHAKGFPTPPPPVPPVVAAARAAAQPPQTTDASGRSVSSAPSITTLRMAAAAGSSTTEATTTPRATGSRLGPGDDHPSSSIAQRQDQKTAPEARGQTQPSATASPPTSLWKRVRRRLTCKSADDAAPGASSSPSRRFPKPNFNLPSPGSSRSASPSSQQSRRSPPYYGANMSRTAAAGVAGAGAGAGGGGSAGRSMPATMARGRSAVGTGSPQSPGGSPRSFSGGSSLVNLPHASTSSASLTAQQQFQLQQQLQQIRNPTPRSTRNTPRASPTMESSLGSPSSPRGGRVSSPALSSAGKFAAQDASLIKTPAKPFVSRNA